MKGRLLVRIGFTAALGLAPSAAWADRTTHEFMITSASSGASDCAQGRCAVYCQVHARLRNTSSRASPRLTVLLRTSKRNSPGVPPPVFSLDFPGLPPGRAALSTDDVQGHACKATTVKSVEVTCSETPDGCRRFLYVHFQAHQAPTLANQKVEGR